MEAAAQETKPKSVPNKLRELGGFLSGYGQAPDFIQTQGFEAALVELAEEVENNYVKLETEGQVPTVAQGVALAQFLRRHFNSDQSHWAAMVARGGAGLGDNYLHVRMNDGYEGGIDKDGRVSA